MRAAAPILKTEAAELGQEIDNKKIISLPLNNRDAFGILGSLTPGVQPTRGNANDGVGVQFNVKGMRQSDNYGMIDGLDGQRDRTREGAILHQSGRGAGV